MHARAVHQALTEHDTLEPARRELSMIVGRDTRELDEEAIARACVESVAENMSDGVTAPLFWALLGALLAPDPSWSLAGAALAAMLYKAANTMVAIKSKPINFITLLISNSPFN